MRTKRELRWPQFMLFIIVLIVISANKYVPTACSWDLKINRIPVGSHEKCTILFEIFTRRRPRRFYRAPTACNCVSTEF